MIEKICLWVPASCMTTTPPVRELRYRRLPWCPFPLVVATGGKIKNHSFIIIIHYSFSATVQYYSSQLAKVEWKELKVPYVN